jgi:hypothetical protein
MATPVDSLTPINYTIVNFSTYTTLQDKMNALFAGNILFIKNFEQKEGADVLIQMVQNKFQVTQISYKTRPTSLDPIYWVTFNVGINDLSLMTVFHWDQEAFSYSNRYMVNDTIQYVNEAGILDSAIITGVYVLNIDNTQFAYSLSNDTSGIYAESDLMQDSFM